MNICPPAFLVLLIPLVRSCFPGRSAQRCSCWPLGCLLVIQSRLPEFSIRQERDLLDQVCLKMHYVGMIANSNAIQLKIDGANYDYCNIQGICT